MEMKFGNMQHLHRIALFTLLSCLSCRAVLTTNGGLHTKTLGYQYNDVSPTHAPEHQAGAVQQQHFGYAYQQPALSNYAQFSLGGAPLYQHTRQTAAFGVVTAQAQDTPAQQKQLANAAEYFVPDQTRQPLYTEQRAQEYAKSRPQQPSYFVPRVRPIEPPTAIPDCQQPVIAEVVPKAGYHYQPGEQKTPQQHQPQPYQEQQQQYQPQPYQEQRQQYQPQPYQEPQQQYFRPANGFQLEVASAAQMAAASQKANDQQNQLHQQQQQQQQQIGQYLHTANSERVASQAAAQNQAFHFPDYKPADPVQSLSPFASAQLYVPGAVPATGQQQAFYGTSREQPSFPLQQLLGVGITGQDQRKPAPTVSATSHLTNIPIPGNGHSELRAEVPSYAEGQKGLGHYQYSLQQPSAAHGAQLLTNEQPQHHIQHQSQYAPVAQLYQQIQAQPQSLPTGKHYPQSGGAHSNALQFQPPNTSSFLQMQSHSYELNPQYDSPRQPHALYGVANV